MGIAVGLDVSELRCGWAICDYDNQQPLALGVESLRERDGGYIEAQVPRAITTIRDRVNSLGHDLEEIVVVGLESVYHGPSIKRTIAHAGVVGMATCAVQLILKPWMVMPIGADEWRAACGISNAGKRADKKARTWEWAMDSLIDHNFKNSYITGAPNISEDEADALGIATACALKSVTSEAA